MTRVAATLVLLALLGVAGCGEDRAARSEDPVQALQSAVTRRDVPAYEHALARIEANSPLSDAALEQLATDLIAELDSDLVWPGDSYPSAVAIVRGADVPFRWIVQAVRGHFDTVGLMWGGKGMMRGPAPPRLAIGVESVPEFRRRLRGTDASPIECWEAALLAQALTPAAALELAPDLVAAMALGDGGLAPNIRAALLNLGAPAVPHLAHALRKGSSYMRQHAAWTLCFMPEVVGPAVPDLRAVLDDPHWQARQYASIALLKHDRTDQQARRTLSHLLVDEQDDSPSRRWIVQGNIVNWLGLVELLPALRAMLKSGELKVDGLEAVRTTIKRLEDLQRRKRNGK